MLNTLALVAGPPFQGFHALSRTLASHPNLAVVQDAHVLTPLAHLGYYDKVYKAPYDHVLAAEAQRLFVSKLPGAEQDYLDACRAYCAHLYRSALPDESSKTLVDATADYAKVLSFARRVFPKARYVVVTRHPLALVASEMDADALADHVREVVAFLRKDDVAALRVSCEDFAADSDAVVQHVCTHIGVDCPVNVIEAGRNEAKALQPLDAWVAAMAGSDALRSRAAQALRRIPSDDMSRYGYAPDQLWEPVEHVVGRPLGLPSAAGAGRRMLGKVGDSARAVVKRHAPVEAFVRKIRLAFDVLLRE